MATTPRTAGLLKDFCISFHDADLLMVTEIYAACENPIEGVDGLSLVEGIKQHGQKQVQYVAEVDELSLAVRTLLQPGDIVLTLGAGDIWRAGEMLLGLLEQGNAAAS
jgi:UDP-N-acetylmuramate--alanine ligase